MKIVIISSYRDACGPAFYSKRLKHAFDVEGQHEVKVLRLDVSLLRVMARRDVMLRANLHLEEIAAEAQDADAVLLQLEPGLYASYPPVAYRRLKKLIGSLKRKVVITVHGFERITSTSFSPLRIAYSLVRKKSIGQALREIYKIGAARHINSFWKYVAGRKNVDVVTFCKADETILRTYHDISRIRTIPISYYSQSEVDDVRKQDRDQNFIGRFGLEKSKKYISVLGFLGRYKGHKTAISALRRLPANYHMLVAGAIHPQSVDVEVEISTYIRELIEFASGRAVKGYIKEDEDVSDRLTFLGPLSDEEIEYVAAFSDFIVLPYLNTSSGQSASGPAVIAAEFGTPSFFSNVPVFHEYSRFFPDGLRFFDVGNSHELSHKILNDEKVRPEIDRARQAALAITSPSSMIKAYEEILLG